MEKLTLQWKKNIKMLNGPYVVINQLNRPYERLLIQKKFYYTSQEGKNINPTKKTKIGTFENKVQIQSFKSP